MTYSSTQVSRPGTRWPVVLRLWLVGALIVSTTDCRTWKRQSAPVPEVVRADDAPGRIRVGFADGTRVELIRPRIEGDSLYGYEERRLHFAENPRIVHEGRTPRRYALADVRSVELRRLNVPGTAAVVVAVGATAVLIAFLSVVSSGGGSNISCPIAHSWDGAEWRIESNTFGGAILPALAYTDIDPIDFAREERGEIRLRLDCGAHETDYVDEFALLAVNHATGTRVVPTEEGGLQAVRDPSPPIAARDDGGRDVLPAFLVEDGSNWESRIAIRDASSSAALRDGVELTFRKPAGATRAFLVVTAQKTAWATHLMRRFVASQGRGIDAWYDSMEADPRATARLRGAIEDEIHLTVALKERDTWTRQGSIWGGGPGAPKSHAVAVDLTHVEGDRVSLRLESTPSFWLMDSAVLALPGGDLEVLEVAPTRIVSPRDGEVAKPLARRDGRHLRLTPGDQLEFRYRVPPTPEGSSRSYLARSHGWYRFHGSRSTERDEAFLASALVGDHAIARTSVEAMNAALRRLDIAAP